MKKFSLKTVILGPFKQKIIKNKHFFAIRHLIGTYRTLSMGENKKETIFNVVFKLMISIIIRHCLIKILFNKFLRLIYG
jgi:hypothetical protein